MYKTSQYKMDINMFSCKQSSTDSLPAQQLKRKIGALDSDKKPTQQKLS